MAETEPVGRVYLTLTEIEDRVKEAEQKRIKSANAQFPPAIEMSENGKGEIIFNTVSRNKNGIALYSVLSSERDLLIDQSIFLLRKRMSQIK